MYRGVRNAAWELLLRVGIRTLPVSSFEIARSMDVPVLGYTKAMPLLRQFDLQDHCRGNDGFALYATDKWYIFLDDRTGSAPARNFTLAHELGHVFLGHELREKNIHGHARVRYTPGTRPRMDRRLERDADMFAARALSPACVLWGLELRTAEELAGACGLPPPVARRRAERMAVLYERDVFLTSEKERRLFLQFADFVAGSRPDGRLPEHCRARLKNARGGGGRDPSAAKQMSTALR